MTNFEKQVLTTLFFAAGLISFSQVGIGTTSPDASAALHLKSNAIVNQGFLLPRMTTANRDANIKTPIGGIVIFNSTEGQFQVTTQNKGWVTLGTSTTVTAATGSTTSTGKIGIGTTSPNANAILDVSVTDKGVLLPLLTADPALIAGLIYYNTTTNKARGCNGSTWVDIN